MANPVNAIFTLEKYEGGGLAPGDLIMQIGQAAFTTTGTEKAVSTDLDTITMAFGVGMTGTPNAADLQLYAATAVSSDTLTFSRPASAEDGLTFSYLIIGTKTS